jgi:DNA-binding LacI/PurR family transcriptional regulator
MKAWHQVTIHDVARAAKVSISTVSKFLNGLQNFSPEVEERISKAVNKLGYKQNPMARSMATGKTGMIGLVIMDIYNPNFVNMIKGANRVALANNYNLLIMDLEESNDRQYLFEALSRRVDGLIVNIQTAETDLKWIQKIEKPVIVLGISPDKKIPDVHANGYKAAILAGNHLLELGRKKIAYVGNPKMVWNKYRIRGLLKAFKDSKVEFDVFDVPLLTMEAGRDAAVRIISSHDRPDAIVGCNDILTIGLMHGVHEMGFSVPEDIAMVGFDNIPVSGYVHPALTTIDMFSETAGEAATKSIISMINDKKFDPGKIHIELKLVVRGSTISNASDR